MAAAAWVDAISAPYNEIRDLYAHDNSSAEFSVTVNRHFSRLFESADAFNAIPVLCPGSTHKDSSMVRFSAMVQDTSADAEMYLVCSPQNQPGGWGLDVATTNQHSQQTLDYSSLRECAIIWATSIPGRSPWTDNTCPPPPSPSEINHIENTGHRNTSRYPIPNTPHISVQIKVYDTTLIESFKPTSLHNFVGIFNQEPIAVILEDQSQPLVPTLHLLYSTPLSMTLDPLIHPNLNLSLNIRDLWNELIRWVADEALAGDFETSRLVLLTAVGRVHSRTPPILPLSLTISGFPSPPSSQSGNRPVLSEVLSHILPLSIQVPLSLPLLNSTRFSPSFTSDDTLQSGLLQLPKGAVLVLSESAISEGILHQQGVENLKTMQEVINIQKLDYIFPYTNYSFDTDLDVIILTEGRKSAFFQTSTTIPLVPAYSNAENRLYRPPGSLNLPSADKIDSFRALLNAAKVGSVSVSEATAQHIQDDFVSSRTKNPSSMNADGLVSQMLIARLLAQVLRKDVVTDELWQETKDIEKQRQQRFA